MATIQLPENWSHTGISNHIEDPWSIEALAEPVKGFVELEGELDLDGCREATYPTSTVKSAHQELQTGSNAGISEANQAFATAAAYIVGEEAYQRATISLRYINTEVPPGCLAGLGGGPHLDASPAHALEARKSRLIGIACDELPTIMYQGPIAWEEFGARGEFKNVDDMEKRFAVSSIGLGVINLMSPSLLHGPAKNETGHDIPRLFMRWTLIY